MLRLGVIGVGAWGVNHVRVIASDPSCVLAAVGDLDETALARARTLAPMARCTSDPDSVISDPSLDAIVIATPAPTHTELTTAVLQAGKHVLIEKPMAMSRADAVQLALHARTRGRVAAVGHLMIHHPAVIRLRELLRGGALGDLRYLHSTRVNLGRVRTDENALWSFGPHDLSMIDYLLDHRLPCSVSARGLSALQPGVEDVVFLALRYETGEMAHVHLSWLNPRKERRLTVIGSLKMAEFDDVEAAKLRVYDKGYDRPPEFTEYAQYLTLRDGDVHIPQIQMQEPLRVQLHHFLECIQQDRRPENDLESGVRVTTVLEAAQRSMANDGAPVYPDANVA